MLRTRYSSLILSRLCQNQCMPKKAPAVKALRDGNVILFVCLVRLFVRLSPETRVLLLARALLVTALLGCADHGCPGCFLSRQKLHHREICASGVRLLARKRHTLRPICKDSSLKWYMKCQVRTYSLSHSLK